MSAQELMNEINQGEGYSLDIKLDQSELETVRSIIKSQWLYRMQLQIPDFISALDRDGMEHYHEHAHLLDHQSSWPTASRILTRKDASTIKDLPFCKKLAQKFGSIELADEAKFGWENMLWRLVRPGNADCAPIHADRWFWDLGRDWPVPSYPHERLNVWIAVYTVPGKNGLLIAPSSQQKKDWKWHTEDRYGQKKPVLDENLETLGLTLLPMEPGDGVIFHHELLHGGSKNLADTTRVSLEFTIFIPTA